MHIDYTFYWWLGTNFDDMELEPHVDGCTMYHVTYI
jgi:hypothetical protein